MGVITSLMTISYESGHVLSFINASSVEEHVSTIHPASERILPYSNLADLLSSIYKTRRLGIFRETISLWCFLFICGITVEQYFYFIK